MEVTLHLSGHCIETAAKKRYEKLVQDLRKKGFDGSREMRVRVKKEGKDFVVEEV